MENLTAVNNAANNFGWSAMGTNNEMILLNRKGSPTARIIVKGNKYIFYDMADNKLLSGNADVGKAAKHLMEKYWYCRPLEIKQDTTINVWHKTNNCDTYLIEYKSPEGETFYTNLPLVELNSILSMRQKEDLFFDDTDKKTFVIESEYDFKKTILRQPV